MSFENGIVTNHSFITIDTILNSSGTDCDINDRCSESNDTEFRRDNCPCTKEQSGTSLPTLIYRFKFTETFMQELYQFSKIHQYDERKDFKEAWIVWTEENQELIQEETRRLLNLGYAGDVLIKMFKSARYYFRKKNLEKKKPLERRSYISVNKELLYAMDEHIISKTYDKDYKPKDGFIEFCQLNEKVLKETILKIYENGITDSRLIEDKIKKTYKNRYFTIINK